MDPHYQHLYNILANSQGYIFPNEIDLQWGILIVVYPFITGLVAGAFILASLERVFNVKIIEVAVSVIYLYILGRRYRTLGIDAAIASCTVVLAPGSQVYHFGS